jgi:hypothetical protein
MAEALAAYEASPAFMKTLTDEAQPPPGTREEDELRSPTTKKPL